MMITNLSSECWWLAWFLSNPLTNPLLYTYTLLSHDPAILLPMATVRLTINHKEKSKIFLKWACQEGFQDMGREMLLTTRWKEEQPQLLIQRWVDHAPNRSWLSSDSTWSLQFIHSPKAEFKHSESSFVSVSVHCVVNLCRWVPGLLCSDTHTSQANLSSTTNSLWFWY